LLDDSNAAKDEMDKVKKKLKVLLRVGHEPPAQFAWPTDQPEPAIVARKVAELMRFHRSVMRDNFARMANTASASLSALQIEREEKGSSPPGAARPSVQTQAMATIQSRWCCGEDPELFRERWEKLFAEFTDSEKVDPSKISELYDSMKFDALHNRQFLEWVFTPSAGMLEEIKDPSGISSGDPVQSAVERLSWERVESGGSNTEKMSEKLSPNTIAQRMGFRRRSHLGGTSSTPPEEPKESYFKLYKGSGQTRAKLDARLGKLRELYQCVKILFDYVCPQEYGISNTEKLEIGLLTSLPLLEEIVQDLEEVQASEAPKSFFYFTKESHSKCPGGRS
jgi:inositol-hexakisphosphate/diphosphoinositol-pentakisphosphate 1-kinase